MLTRGLAIAAYLIGIGGASVFFLFVLGTGTGLLPRLHQIHEGLEPWCINTALLLLFGLQHSVMARPLFKKLLTSRVPAHLERSTYVAAAGIAIMALTLLWQPLSGGPIWDGPTWIVGISLGAALGLIGCCGSFNHAAFFGLTQAWTGIADVQMPLRIVGPYRYVRHPLMLGVLVALWAQPHMPPELFMLNAGMTLYILIAIPLEERDLLRAYGTQYEEYRNQVPMLIPWALLIRRC